MIEESASPMGQVSAGLDAERLRPSVLFEADAGLFEQFCHYGKIPLRIVETGMPEIGRQVRQQPLDVLAFAVPCDESYERRMCAGNRYRR